MAVFKGINISNLRVPSAEKMFGKQAIGKRVDWVEVDGSITEENIRSINSTNNYTVLVLKNTKGQNSELLKKINSSYVRFSVLGGLNYKEKIKYNDSSYILRTIHTPLILSKVIEYFDKIERGIRYTWTDRQKCMYVYKCLVEGLHYNYKGEPEFVDGKDIVRSYEGLLHGRLVCAGFALVFKEMMDRIGIPCAYQNKRHHHSWNIVKLDNNIIGVDLTWDCSNKDANNKCNFLNFGMQENFYDDSHHDISMEPEEIKADLKLLNQGELKNDISIINNKGNVKKLEMNSSADNKGVKVNYLLYGIYENYPVYLVNFNNKNELLVLEKQKNIEEELKKESIQSLVVKGLMKSPYKDLIKQIRIFFRNDGSSFFVRDNEKYKNGVNEFSYCDVIKEKNKAFFRIGIILSEMNILVAYNDDIANKLLTKDRVREKVLFYNGYVGYISNNTKYYNPNFEEELGIYRRK